MERILPKADTYTRLEDTCGFFVYREYPKDTTSKMFSIIQVMEFFLDMMAGITRAT
jgi:hypothetical protein